jgi:phasin family protein
MKQPIEAINAAQTANADTALALMRNTLDAIERLAALNLNTMRDVLATSASQNAKMAEAKDLATASQALAQPSVERTRAYYHQVYDLMSEMQDQLTKVMQSHYNTLSENATSATNALASSTPVGGEAFAAAMKAMLDANTKAFEKINETAHQLQAGVREMGSTMSKQAESAAKSATAKAAGATRKKTT